MVAGFSATIRPLLAIHEISSFSCGKPTLDDWLRSRAVRNQASGDSRTFVRLEDGRVIGFYALTTGSAARVGLPGALRRNAPDPVPLLLLAQLAVDLRHRGKGVGRELLRDALMRMAAASEQIGFRAVATHPLDADAEAFYCRFGFTAVPDSTPRLMLLPLQGLLSARAAALANEPP